MSSGPYKATSEYLLPDVKAERGHVKVIDESVLANDCFVCALKKSEGIMKRDGALALCVSVRLDWPVFDSYDEPTWACSPRK